MSSRILKVLIGLLCVAALLIAVFLGGRYGWKLLGFSACETAGIEQIHVEEGSVRICGYCPGLVPEGFLGYYAEQANGTLYIGFRFSALFGFFETGDFEITVPTEGTVDRVVLKSAEREYTLWPAEG